MDLRRPIARAIIPIAVAITVIAPLAPTTPVVATEPAPAEAPLAEPAPTPAPADPVVVVPAPTPGSVASTASSKRRRTAADHLVAVARRKIGDRYVYGASGPRRFDCSGLVLFALRHSHNRRVVRHGLRSASAIYHSYRRHHRVSRRHGHRGDLVVWGGGRHIGIYLGHGRAISALTRRGVRVHRVHAMTMPFTGFLHTRLYRHR